MLIICSYSLLLMLAVGGSSLLQLVLVMETLSWVFVLLAPSGLSLSYLIIQSYFVFFMFITMNFIVSMALVLLLKMGLPPFHSWIISLLNNAESDLLLFMISIHKALPIIFLSKLMFEGSLMFLIMVVMNLASLMILQLTSAFQVIMYSSMAHSVWLIISSLMSLAFFLFYMGLYMSLSLILIKSAKAKWASQLALKQSSLTLLMWLVLAGFPPFSVFWIKALIVSWMTVALLFMSAAFPLAVAVVSLSAYYRVSHLEMGLTSQPNSKLFVFIGVSAIILTTF